MNYILTNPIHQKLLLQLKQDLDNKANETSEIFETALGQRVRWDFAVAVTVSCFVAAIYGATYLKLDGKLDFNLKVWLFNRVR